MKAGKCSQLYSVKFLAKSNQMEPRTVVFSDRGKKMSGMKLPKKLTSSVKISVRCGKSPGFSDSVQCGARPPRVLCSAALVGLDPRPKSLEDFGFFLRGLLSPSKFSLKWLCAARRVKRGGESLFGQVMGDNKEKM